MKKSFYTKEIQELNQYLELLSFMLSSLCEKVN
jgi:hypothetical protein